MGRQVGTSKKTQISEGIRRNSILKAMQMKFAKWFHWRTLLDLLDI